MNVCSYHEKVRRRNGAGKDPRTLQVPWQWGAKVGIVEHAQILGLGRIGSANLSGLDREVGLSQTTSLDQIVNYWIAINIVAPQP